MSKLTTGARTGTPVACLNGALPAPATARGTRPASVLWSWGVRLFRSMNFRSKALLVSAVFLAVVGQLTFIYVRASQDGVNLARREQVGVAQFRQLVQLMGLAQDLRQLRMQAGGPLTPEIKPLMEKMQTQLHEFDGSVTAALGLAESVKFVQNAFTPVKAGAADAEEAFQRGDMLVDQLLRLGADVADASGLALDPETTSYHLMLASTQEVPLALQTLGRMRDLGGLTLATRELTPASRRFLAGDSYHMSRHLETVFARYERVVKAAPELAQALAFEEAFKPVNAFLRSVRRGPLADAGPTGDAAAYAASAQAALAAMNALVTRSYTTLDSLIGQRAQALERARGVQLGMVLAGLLAAAYLFNCFYLGTRDGMQEVLHHVEAMARGDLSTAPQIVGRDESTALMLAIQAMQSSLRTLIGQVRECTGSIVSTSTQVSAGAQDLSERTEKTAGSLQQAAAAMEQIAATVKQTAEKSGESARLGRENARVADEGGEVIGRAVQTMHEIQASSRKISEIIGVIDSIAFQTNLLALNAAVEAARAGDSGRGFAVVAAEVRTLAQRSAGAAQQIKELITASTEQTCEGARIVNDAGRSMTRMVSNAQTMSGLLADVSASTSEQTRSVEQVSVAVAQLDHDTQCNAALVEQTTAAAFLMQQRAGDLAAMAERFVLEPA